MTGADGKNPRDLWGDPVARGYVVKKKKHLRYASVAETEREWAEVLP